MFAACTGISVPHAGCGTGMQLRMQTLHAASKTLVCLPLACGQQPRQHSMPHAQHTSSLTCLGSCCDGASPTCAGSVRSVATSSSGTLVEAKNATAAAVAAAVSQACQGDVQAAAQALSQAVATASATAWSKSQATVTVEGTGHGCADASSSATAGVVCGRPSMLAVQLCTVACCGGGCGGLVAATSLCSTEASS